MAEREDLLIIRNEILNKPVGQALLRFLHDELTSNACKNLDAVEIRGMARQIQAIKDIPKKL